MRSGVLGSVVVARGAVGGEVADGGFGTEVAGLDVEAEAEAEEREGRVERMESRVSLGEVERVVATMGRVGGVVRRRWRVRAHPMPREEGVTSAQAMVGWLVWGRSRRKRGREEMDEMVAN